jgi:3-hydroxyacyl-[acyl-carrier-protein] dehydratase
MKMVSSLSIPEDHASFAGHFPGVPVLPGAILLDETLRAIGRARGIDLTQWLIVSAKFLDAVRPRDILRVEHDAAPEDVIRFSIHAENRKVAGGTLSKPQRDSGP